jgi:hypothetical protein
MYKPLEQDHQQDQITWKHKMGKKRSGW